MARRRTDYALHRTADRQRALTIGARIEAEKRAEWLQLLESAARAEATPQPTILTARLIEQIRGARLGSWQRTDETERTEQGLSESQLRRHREFATRASQLARSILAQGKGAKA